MGFQQSYAKLYKAMQSYAKLCKIKLETPFLAEVA